MILLLSGLLVLLGFFTTASILAQKLMMSRWVGGSVVAIPLAVLITAVMAYLIAAAMFIMNLIR